jgi:hypothetical protein
MKLPIKTTRPLFALLVLIFAGIAANAQDAARLQFDRLNRLESKARDVVEVNIDGKLLDLAKRVTAKVKDDDAKKVALAINGLRGIYVRVYNFDKENEYEPNDIDEIRAQLNSPGWEKLANVRSKRNNQKVDVFTMFSGDKMDGLAIVLSEAKTVAVVNVIGMVDIETLVELSGKMNIPKIDILRDDKPKNEKED